MVLPATLPTPLGLLEFEVGADLTLAQSQSHIPEVKPKIVDEALSVDMPPWDVSDAELVGVEEFQRALDTVGCRYPGSHLPTCPDLLGRCPGLPGVFRAPPPWAASSFQKDPFLDLLVATEGFEPFGGGRSSWDVVAFGRLMDVLNNLGPPQPSSPAPEFQDVSPVDAEPPPRSWSTAGFNHFPSVQDVEMSLCLGRPQGVDVDFLRKLCSEGAAGLTRPDLRSAPWLPCGTSELEKMRLLMGSLK